MMEVCNSYGFVVLLQVTVRAGTTLGELVSYLDKNGLALSNLPAITEQTVAGCLSTGEVS